MRRREERAREQRRCPGRRRDASLRGAPERTDNDGLEFVNADAIDDDDGERWETI